MSNQEPSFLTRLKNISPRTSQNICNTFITRPKLQARNQIIWMKNSDTTRNGMSILMRSNAPIRNGLKIATKHRIEEGSKLFKLAILPVAKKEQKMMNRKDKMQETPTAKASHENFYSICNTDRSEKFYSCDEKEFEIKSKL